MWYSYKQFLAWNRIELETGDVTGYATEISEMISILRNVG